MKSWTDLEPDEYKLLSKHYTAGRSGSTIRHVVIHHNGGNLSIQGCYDVWQTREASAHYQVDASGQIGQLVHHADTAWHAGSWAENIQSIGIEHADISTSPWRVSDATLDNGAHLVAAICRAYKLGRPQWGVNVFPHRQFSATECPASLAGDQQGAYMARAQAYYDQMTGTTTTTTTKPAASVTTKPAASTTADGYWGSGTTRALQRVLGTTVDGVVSSQSSAWRSQNPGLTTGWEWVSSPKGSRVISALQRKLGVAADGLIGPATIRALQKRMGTTQDGCLSEKSQCITALQQRLQKGTI